MKPVGRHHYFEPTAPSARLAGRAIKWSDMNSCSAGLTTRLPVSAIGELGGVGYTKSRGRLGILPHLSFVYRIYVCTQLSHHIPVPTSRIHAGGGALGGQD